MGKRPKNGQNRCDLGGGIKISTRFRGGEKKNCRKINHVMHRFQLGHKKYPISTVLQCQCQIDH